MQHQQQLPKNNAVSGVTTAGVQRIVKSEQQTDFLIIGAGILGITIALEIKKQLPDQKIIILEKESSAGFHASGRNSGVLHAGFYYAEDSLKARFCRDGNREMKNYCKENNINLNENGKLVVTKNEAELSALKILYDRGIKNGVSLALIDAQSARQIEPRVRTVKQAIFSPNTASVNPVEVMCALTKKATSLGVLFYFNEKYIKQKNKIIVTNKRKIKTGFVVNAAGLYADKIAKEYGFGIPYEIIPFKGLYLYGSETASRLKTHIYPVPDLNYPFLGVHFTVTAEGKTKIGPTAIPAFWREHYHHLKNFSFTEMLQIIKRESILFTKNKANFRKVALHELKKYRKSYLANQAAYMLDDFSPHQFKTWGKPGIRAQLIDKRDNTFITDFCYEGDQYSFHVLNAVSPAFTCALPFSRFLVQQMQVSAVK